MYIVKYLYIPSKGHMYEKVLNTTKLNDFAATVYALFARIFYITMYFV